MPSRQLLIDGQLFQTNTWHRGMGKYSLDLLQSLSRAGYFNSYDKVRLLLNDRLVIEPDKLEVLNGVFKFEIEYLSLELLDNFEDISQKRQQNVKTLDNFIARNRLSDFDHLLLSIFEDNVISTYATNSKKKMMILYDLIPYLFGDQYLSSKETRDSYFSHFPIIFDTDLVFTISETTKNDLISYTGFPVAKIVNIDGAPISLMRRKIKPKKFTNAPKKYVLFPSGNDIRKNNLRTVKAFNHFNEQHNNEYKLLITSTFDAKTQNYLRKFCDHIIFTENVDEEVMQWLYKNAEGIVFPPLYEGLGLPILEAIDSGTSFACSDIPVFREMVNGAPFNLFNPESIDSIALGIEKAVKGPFRASEFTATQKKYTWKNTANKFIAGYNNYKSSEVMKNKPKLAIVAPHPRGQSTIAKVVQLLNYQTMQNFDVTYYLEDNDSGFSKPEFLSYSAHCRDVNEFLPNDYKTMDRVIYHIGNSDYHLNTLMLAERFPGDVILHDTDLSGLFEVLKERGLISNERHTLEQELSKMLKLNESKFMTTLANSSQNIYCHSKYSSKSIQKNIISGRKNVFQIDLPVPEPVRTIRNPYTNTLNIGLAGILHTVKGLDIIKSLAEDEELSRHQFKIFGFNFATEQSSLNELGLMPNVELSTNVSDLSFSERLDSLDVLINYRLEYRGESSYTTLEGLRSGACVIVRDIGWYSELPDEVVVKVHDETEIKDAIIRLARDRPVIDEYSRKSRDYIKKVHSLGEYVHSIIEHGNNPLSSAGLVAKKIKQSELLSAASIKEIYEIAEK